MDYSTKKVKIGEKEAYVFDLIMNKSRDWLKDNLLNDLQGKERKMYDIKVSLSPSTNTEIDASDFMKVLEPYMSEPLFKTQSVLYLCETLKNSISDFNKEVKVHYSHDDYRFPFWEKETSENTVWTPFVFDFPQSLSYTCSWYKQKFKKNKCTKEEFDSAERVRKDIIPVISKKFDEVLDIYAGNYRPFVTAFSEWLNTYRGLEMAYGDFCKEVRPTTELTFGKHRGDTMRYVIEHDLYYAKWLMKTKPEFEMTKADLELFIERAGYDPYERKDKKEEQIEKLIALIEEKNLDPGKLYNIVKMITFFEDRGFDLPSINFVALKKPDIDILDEIWKELHKVPFVEKVNDVFYRFGCSL